MGELSGCGQFRQGCNNNGVDISGQQRLQPKSWKNHSRRDMLPSNETI